jgi:hypothetical protein
LLWLLVAAAIKTDRLELASKALELAQTRLPKDQWPEYYDSRNGRLIGKEARRHQTWTVCGFLMAKELIANPDHLSLISFEKDPQVIHCVN